ncbi:MAG: hypothetical protein ACK5WF_24000 [Cyclobacteriaceae bacterium]
MNKLTAFLTAPNCIASRINRNIIAPQFSEGNYCKGIYLALDSMKYLIERDRTLIGREN